MQIRQRLERLEDGIGGGASSVTLVFADDDRPLPEPVIVVRFVSPRGSHDAQKAS